MKRPQGLLAGPLGLALLGMIFCLWSVFGNDINICITSGCSLYQDFTVGGISLWWFGAAAFGGLALLALAGAPGWGRIFSGAALLGDVCLLAVMALTAPCVSCLVAAVLFALCYVVFRAADQEENPKEDGAGTSILLWAWLALFLFNVACVVRAQGEVWAINEIARDANGDAEPSVRVFFSPTCPACRQGVEALAGKTDVGFYPVTENEEDLIQVLAMARLLEEGRSMDEALIRSAKAVKDDVSLWSPEAFWLRFRILRNKAHIFLAGAKTVPFFEYRGLPSQLAAPQRAQPARRLPPAEPAAPAPSPAAAASPAAGILGGELPAQPELDAPLPADIISDSAISGRCGAHMLCR